MSNELLREALLHIGVPIICPTSHGSEADYSACPTCGLRTRITAALESGGKAAQEGLPEEFLIPHETCEDCWYSCPKSPEGCCNEGEGTECNCGADSYNEKISKLRTLAVNLKAELTEAKLKIEAMERATP